MKIYHWKNPAIKYIVSAFLVLFVLLYVRECRAFSIEAGAGTTLGDPGQQPVGELSLVTDSGHWDVSLGYLDTDKNEVAYLGVARVVHFLANDLDSPSLFLGLVANTHSDGDYYLDQHLNFILGVQTGYKNFRVEYKHISNAGTNSPNIGLNFILMNWRF